jgi:hypothetical protein
MGRGLICRSHSYIQRGDRKRLRLLLGKHPDRHQSAEAMLLDYAILQNRLLENIDRYSTYEVIIKRSR